MVKRQPKAMTSQEKLSLREEVLKLFLVDQISVEEAMSRLKLSRSSLYRLSKRFALGGKVLLEHGNHNRVPVNKLDESLRAHLKELLGTKYADFQPALAVQYLRREEAIVVSRETVRRIMRELSPSERTSKGGTAHKLRRRRSRFGELIQIDGCTHNWFGNENTCLIAFIDDATGMITSAIFYETERSEGYLHCIEKHVMKYGIPLALYSDRHGIFDSVIKNANGTSGPTQYQRACDALGIEMIRAFSPQAKGRIERLFWTLQNRWPKEFKLKEIQTMKQANDVLEEYIEQFNHEFSIDRNELQDAHVKLSSHDAEAVHRICAQWHPRKLSKQLTCRFNATQLQVVANERMLLAYQPVDIVEYDDGKLEMVWTHVEQGKRVSKLLPFKQTSLDQVPEFIEYEPSKTIDARLDKIRMSEQNRRSHWIDQRRQLAQKRLDEREKEVEELEAKVRNLPSKSNH